MEKQLLFLDISEKWSYKAIYCPQIGETNRWMLVAYWYTVYMGNDTATFKDSLAVFLQN